MAENSKIPQQQISIEGFRHGGLREGAGRPNLSGEPSHIKRPDIEQRLCADIQFLVHDDVPGLRKAILFRQFKKALSLSAQKGWKILHFALKSNSISLLVECDNNAMLESCTKSFATSLSKRINLIEKRKGPVFKGRYRISLLDNILHFNKVLKTKYTPKNPFTEAPKFYLSWNSTAELEGEELHTVLASPTLNWLRQGIKSS